MKESSQVGKKMTCTRSIRGVVRRYRATTWFACLALATSGACGSSSVDGDTGGGNGGVPDGAPLPNDGEFEAVFTWAPIDLDNSTDLGADVRAIAESDQVAASDVMLSEVATSSGLGDSVAGGNRHGVGVGFVDIDGDTFHDIVLVTGEHPDDGVTDSQVYRNNGDGTFSEFTDESNIGTILAGVDGYSVASADYDRDGDLDLYIGAMPNDFFVAQ